jgi:DNA-binding beta-propeller fold protein YncE
MNLFTTVRISTQRARVILLRVLTLLPCNLGAQSLWAASCVEPQDPGPPAELRALSLEPDEAGDGPVGLAFVRSGSELVVLHRATADLTFFDARSGERLARLALDGDPNLLAVSPDGAMVFVSDRESDQIAGIDVVSRAIVWRRATEARATRGLVVTPDGREVVAVPGPGTLPPGLASVHDAATGALLRTFPIDLTSGWEWELPQPAAVLSGDGARVLVTGRTAGVYDAQLGQRLWSPGGGPLQSEFVWTAWLDHSGDRALCSASGPGKHTTLWEIDVLTGAAVARHVGSYDTWVARLAVAAHGRRVAYSANTTHVVDLATQTVQSLPMRFAHAATRDGSLVLGLAGSPPGYAVADVLRGVQIGWGQWKAPIPDLVASGPGTLVAVASKRTERVAVLDLAALRVLWDRASGPGIEVEGLTRGRFARAGRWFVSLSTAGRALLITDVESGALVAAHELGYEATDLAVGGDTVLLRCGADYVCAAPKWAEVRRLPGAELVATVEAQDFLTLVGVEPRGRRAFVLAGDCVTADLVEVDIGAAGGPVERRVPLTGQSQTVGTLSPKGRWILVPSWPGVYRLFDTTTLAEVATVPAENYGAARCTEDDQTLYVARRLAAPALDRYDLATGMPVATGTWPLHQGQRLPWEIELDGVGERLWLVSEDGVSTFDLATGAVRGLPATLHYGAVLSALGPHAWVASTGVMTRYFDDGTNLVALESDAQAALGTTNLALDVQLSRERGLIAFHDSTRSELHLLELGVVAPRRYCTQPAANSAGTFGALDVSGSRVAGGGPFGLEASGLPSNVLALVLAGPVVAHVPSFGAGILCVGPLPQRFTDRVRSTDVFGRAEFTLTPNELIGPLGLGVAHGQTWMFQVVHRDTPLLGGAGLSEALAVYFR